MKQIILITFLICFTNKSYSQTFNGDYRSYKTSYEDYSTTSNNFIEETEFKIAVFISENNTEGRIAIQDPRIPEKLLIYKVVDFIDKLDNEGVVSYLYKCETDHLENLEELILTFYYPTDKKLSLMIYSNESSQVFFDLQKK